MLPVLLPGIFVCVKDLPPTATVDVMQNYVGLKTNTMMTMTASETMTTTTKSTLTMTTKLENFCWYGRSKEV